MGSKKKKSKTSHRKKRKAHKITWPLKPLAIILTIGFILRIIYDLSLSDNIFFGHYILDSLVLHSWALDILKGTTADTAFFRAPLYPYMVAFLYNIFGVSAWSVVLFQNLLGLLTAVVSYLFARRLFGERLALWVGIVVVSYPTLIYFEGEIMITSLAVFLYTIAMYRLYIAVQSPSPKQLALAGLCLGLAAITRPAILPLIVIFPVAYFVKYGRASLKKTVIHTVVLGAVTLIPILPVTIANLAIGGEFVLISTQGGANFYIGNNAKADGLTVVAPGPNLRLGKYNDNIWTSSVDEANKRAGKQLTQSEVSAFWFGETMREIADNIPHFLTLYLKKFYLFWHGQEIFNNKSLYFAGQYSRFMKLSLWKYGLNFPSGLLFPLMFAGIFFAFRDRRDTLAPALYLIGFSALMALFFVCARFRQPVIPVAVMFAVYAMASLIRLRKENQKFFFIGGLSVLLLVVVFNWGGNIESKKNLSQFNVFIGNAYLKNNDFDKGIPFLEKSLEIAPDNVGVYDMIGQAYLKVGDIAKAEEIYQKGLKLFPVYPHFNFGLGRISQLKNENEAAKDYYRQTLYNAPEFAPAADRLGFIFDQEGQIDSALYYYELLDRLKPNDLRLQAKIEELKKLAGSRQ